MQTPPSLVERLIFNKISAIAHTVWFGTWTPIFGLSMNALTLVVSLEAIYLSIFIGISTQHVHQHIDRKNNGN